MEFGFCTYFAAQSNQQIDYKLLNSVQAAGFDFIELPLFLIESLSPLEFDQLKVDLRDSVLSTKVCANLFPDHMIVTGPTADHKTIHNYLSQAFSRADQLGIRKIIFASVPAWQTPKGITRAEGVRRIVSLISGTILAEAEQFNIKILIEPLRNTICDLVTTLSEGMQIVEQVNSPLVNLMADLYHLEINREDPHQMEKYLDHIEHIHIAQPERVLPTEKYSPTIGAFLGQLKSSGYNDSISFETAAPTDTASLRKALNLLKAQFSD